MALIARMFLTKKLLNQQPLHKKLTQETASTPLVAFLQILTPEIAQSAAASLWKVFPQGSP